MKIMEKKLSVTTNYFLKENPTIENPTFTDVENWVLKNYPNYSPGQTKAVSNHIFDSIK